MGMSTHTSRCSPRWTGRWSCSSMSYDTSGCTGPGTWNYSRGLWSVQLPGRPGWLPSSCDWPCIGWWNCHRPPRSNRSNRATSRQRTRQWMSGSGLCWCGWRMFARTDKRHLRRCGKLLQSRSSSVPDKRHQETPRSWGLQDAPASWKSLPQLALACSSATPGAFLPAAPTLGSSKAARR